MKHVSYVQPLGADGKIKISFTKDRGKIKKFVVQYYARVNHRWRTIMRIDNCHGFAHRHVYYYRKKEFKIALPEDINKAFTQAKQYLLRNHEKIKENFLLAK